MNLVKFLFPSLTWHIPAGKPALYLTFDDGPIPEVTPFVLELLKQYNAKATFFCVGENVSNHPGIFKQIQDDGHAVGNHTYHHLNGWKTRNDLYGEDIEKANTLIRSDLFRPPYGRIKPSQYSILKKYYSIIMWDVLSKDYDESMSGNQCLQRVLHKAKPGSIIVFHDSLKAFDRMKFALPTVLEHFSTQGYSFNKITHSKKNAADSQINKLTAK